ncbi:MAG: hypothetical protein R3C53_22890 [Pirellulaceae bacterium]
MTLIQRIRTWTMRLPTSWGLGQADIHSSLLLTLGLLSGLVLLLSYSRADFAELRTLAFSLPAVWVVSLTVRIAAQQLSIGVYSLDMTTSVGPTGNLSTDYEYLPSNRILGYAAAGQLATAGMILLGMVVNAAMIPAEGSELRFSQLLDVTSGWSSRAWASQIMWVNVFIGVLNLLPTVPFDARAAVFAFYSKRNRNTQEPHVFRRIAAFDSHLAAVLLGAGLTAVLLGFVFGKEIVGWYVAVAAAVYLFVASCWETSRAEEIEEQYAPLAPRMARTDFAHSEVPSLNLGTFADDDGSRGDDPVTNYIEEASQSADEILNGGYQPDSIDPQVDVDEILRKLHREGSSALSMAEQQALLSASRELKQRRSGRT